MNNRLAPTLCRDREREDALDSNRLHLLAAVARRDLFFRRVLCSGFLDHLANHFTVAGHERRYLLEAVAIPLLELHHSRAFVIRAARLDRREETGSADFLDAGLGEVEVLEAVAELVGGHDFALAV